MSTKEHLIAEIDAGKQFEYVFFWGHTGPPDRRVGPTCCSQWYPAPFSIDGVTYATTEHYMMACKARTFHDEAILAQVLVAKTPAIAKALGRKVSGFDGKVWAAIAIEVVVAGNLAKFSQNAAMGEWLKASAPAILVEASPVDEIWGTGIGQDGAGAADPKKWPGKNQLGFALMEVRRQLLGES